MFLFGNLRELTPGIDSKITHRIQTIVLKTADKLLPKSREFRRGHVYPRAFRLAGPSEFIDTTENGLETLNSLMEEGYGVLVIHNHLSERDSFEPPRHWFRKVPMMRRVPMIYAISAHNVDERSEAVSEMFGTDLGVVVTKHSAEEDSSLQEGAGIVSFARKALRVFHPSIEDRKKGVLPGVVVVASTPWRQDFLGEPVIRTVEQFGKIVLAQQERNRQKEMLESQLQEGVLSPEGQQQLYKLQRPQIFPDKLAVIFVGISVKGVRLYQQHLTGGWNRGETYRNKMSKIYKIEDLFAEANAASERVDDYGFDILRTLVDSQFGDPKSGDKVYMQYTPARDKDQSITVFDPLIDLLRLPGKLFPRFSF